MRKTLAAFAVSIASAGVGAGVGAGAFSGAAQAEPYSAAVLQGLDKITARISTFTAPLDETMRFGTLEIIVRHCDKRPPEDPPESAAFLEIWAVSPGRPTSTVFRGWMFASSPALSALEHPVYDVWVLDCTNAQIEDVDGAE
ncbi:MAG: DUF2155 domain-containing protein [Rhodospirillales bacterium]